MSNYFEELAKFVVFPLSRITRSRKFQFRKVSSFSDLKEAMLFFFAFSYAIVQSLWAQSCRHNRKTSIYGMVDEPYYVG